MVFKKLKRAFSDSLGSGDSQEEYLEIDVTQESPEKKVLVKLYTLKVYEEVNEILNSLREGYTIAMIDIRPLRQKDSIELKRAIAKIKKTTDALGGSVAGFGDNIIIVTPSFAKVHKDPERPKEDAKSNRFS
jgi:SepF-like predicted cell division protein (DUF552 family)